VLHTYWQRRRASKTDSIARQTASRPVTTV